MRRCRAGCQSQRPGNSLPDGNVRLNGRAFMNHCGSSSALVRRLPEPGGDRGVHDARQGQNREQCQSQRPETVEFAVAHAHGKELRGEHPSRARAASAWTADCLPFLDPAGYMCALNAATGAILWSFASGGSCVSGAAVSDGMLFWGSGYSKLGTPNNKLFAFGIPN